MIKSNCFLLFLILTLSFSSSLAKKFNFKKGVLTIGAKKLTIEIAESRWEIEKGLMGRKLPLGKKQGMLFIYLDEKIRDFWMKNTYIPLSLGFFDANKVLVEIAHLNPAGSVLELKIPSYRSKKKAKYVLEVDQGWFSQMRISTDKKMKFQFHKI